MGHHSRRLRQSADAEYVAGLSGTYKTTKRTEQTMAALVGHEQTGLGSAREVDEYHVSPNLVRGLPQGYAVVQSNAPARLDLAGALTVSFKKTTWLQRFRFTQRGTPGFPSARPHG